MSYQHVPRIHLSRIERYDSCVESIRPDRKSISNSISGSKSRRWFCDLLWRAFPSQSENDLANKAAPVLGVSARQVRNWLREENDASLKYVAAVLAVAGAEIVFKQIEGRE
jgi:hypothetical protein